METAIKFVASVLAFTAIGGIMGYAFVMAF